MSLATLALGPIASIDHADAVLELAFLMCAVDGHLAEEELVTFHDLVDVVRGRRASKKEVDDLLERFVVAAHGAGVDARVRTVAALVPKELRETAFTIAVALALVDHDENEHEDELVGVLGAALELAERAVTLARETRAALGC